MDGQWRRVPLHMNVERNPKKPPEWEVSRGTNLVDSYHSLAHKLFVHSGGNMSPQLVQNMLTQHLWLWNLNRRIKLDIMPDPGITDLSLIIEVNEEAQQLKFDAKDLPWI